MYVKMKRFRSRMRLAAAPLKVSTLEEISSVIGETQRRALTLDDRAL